MNTAKSFATRLLSQEAPEDHPFYRAMKDGSLSLEKAQQAALEIRHVVAHFPRFLAALIANIPDYRERMDLVENLYYEHGKMNESEVHEVTYRRFLHSLDISEEAIEAHEPGLPALVYTRAVHDLCLHQEIAEGFGAIGVIEEIVARVSIAVSHYAARHLGQVGPDDHFGLHEVLDVTHADEIYALAEPYYKGTGRQAVERGMRLGHYYHLRLYSDIMALSVG